MGWKEYYNRTDETCPTCGAVTKKARGITRQNLKYFVWHKPTAIEMVVLVFILLALVQTWAYRHDTEICRAVVQRDILYWNNVSLNQTEPSRLPYFNITALNITAADG